MSNNPSCPVFIVGPSRCGNTLLQEVLNLHSRLHICSETHWFDDDRSIRCHAIETDEDRKQSQDWFLSLSDRPFGYNGDPDQGWLDRSDLEREARGLTTDAPRDSYFVAWCQLDAAQHGKARWGEKTPRHVFRISDILQAFPDAKILCCIRNAPAMIASYRQWGLRTGHDLEKESSSTATEVEKQRTRASYHPAIAAMLWRGAVRSSLRAREQFGEDRVKLVFYEQLVLQPEGTVSDLVDWLGETFEPQTLSVPMVNSSFDQHQADAGFVSHPLDRWQQQLDASDLAVIQLLCSNELRRLDYAAVSEWHQLWRALPAMLRLPMAVLRAARANQDRTGHLLPYIWRRVKPDWL